MKIFKLIVLVALGSFLNSSIAAVNTKEQLSLTSVFDEIDLFVRGELEAVTISFAKIAPSVAIKELGKDKLSALSDSVDNLNLKIVEYAKEKKDSEVFTKICDPIGFIVTLSSVKRNFESMWQCLEKGCQVIRYIEIRNIYLYNFFRAKDDLGNCKNHMGPSGS